MSVLSIDPPAWLPVTVIVPLPGLPTSYVAEKLKMSFGGIEKLPSDRLQFDACPPTEHESVPFCVVLVSLISVIDHTCPPVFAGLLSLGEHVLINET